MRIHVTSNKNYINISFYKIDLMKVYQLLEYMNIDYVSILLNEFNEYIFRKYILIDDFVNYISNINSSVIVFDDKVESCLIDKELDILRNKKILVDIDLGENMTCILINTNNINITKEEIKKIFKK
ncbi:MAG: hypothetical protein SOV26_04455 [Candidatus Onthovivens sp.]|nr:hypothetical protein [Candidatus Onthovivens sp.]